MSLLNKAQGSIEYLLLLAAAIVVVAVVISFMITTIQPVQDSGSRETYNYICGTLDTNSLVCGCYECDASKGDNSTKMATITNCTAVASEKNDSLLDASTCGTALPP